MTTVSSAEQQLRKRIVELETQLLAFKNAPPAAHRASAEEEEEALAQLKLDFITATTNNEILSGNVETLRSLSLQLAVQLEEANIAVKTLQDQLEIANLKAERDKNLELAQLRADYDDRLSELRKALHEEEAAMRDTVVMWENREEAAERRLLLLEREKDKTISSLTHEIEVLRQGLYDGIDRAARPQLRSSAETGIQAPALGRSADPEKSNLVVLTLALPADQADSLRFGSDERLPPTAAFRRKRKFHIDILADPTILEAVDDVKPDTAGGASANAGAEQRWLFRLPTGEMIRLSAHIL